MYKGVDPILEDRQLTIGDIVVPLDQFNDLWIDFPSLPDTAIFLAKHTPAGISAAEVLLELEDIPDDEWDEENNAFDLDVDMNERDNVDNLVSMKSGALLSISCDVSSFLTADTTFFNFQR